MKMMQIISRKEAKERGLTRYFTGKPCKNAHVVERYAATGNCVSCHRDGSRSAMGEKYRTDDVFAQKERERKRLWKAGNREKLRQYHKSHRDANRPVYRSYFAARRSAKRFATPQWLTSEQRKEIIALYAEARRLEAATGKKFHVDHIVPLSGNLVSGLHVPWNLQVIEAGANFRKSNRHA